MNPNKELLWGLWVKPDRLDRNVATHSTSSWVSHCNYRGTQNPVLIFKAATLNQGSEITFWALARRLCGLTVLVLEAVLCLRDKILHFPYTIIPIV